MNLPRKWWGLDFKARSMNLSRNVEDGDSWGQAWLWETQDCPCLLCLGRRDFVSRAEKFASGESHPGHQD